jgi:hypothetical protein
MSTSFAPTSCGSCARSRERKGPRRARKILIAQFDQPKGMTAVLADEMQFLRQLLTTVSSMRSEQIEAVVGESSDDPEMPWKVALWPNRCTSDAAMPPLRLPPITNQLSVRDKRLLEHMSKFYSPLISNTSPKFVLWTRGIQE